MSGRLKQTGSFIGTGAALEIALPFNPRYVEVVNLTTLTKGFNHEHNDVALKEGGVKTIIDGTMSAMTAAEGITLGDRKFTVGTAAQVNGSGDTHVFLAIE